MRIDIITIFPEVILPVLQAGILKRAQARDLLTVNVHNLRDFTTDRHQTVDDYPYGGGAGMILKPEPLFAAIRSAASRINNAYHLPDPAGNAL